MATAGIKALESSIRRLTKKASTIGRQMVSVVHSDEEGNIEWPEGVEFSPGVLVVPKPVDLETWEMLSYKEESKG